MSAATNLKRLLTNFVFRFIFDSYYFDKTTRTAHFKYRFEDGISFEEKITFESTKSYDAELLERALFLAFILIGTSYYKTFPSLNVILKSGSLDQWQANFFNSVYQEGMSQFAFENNLKRHDLAHFDVSNNDQPPPLPYSGKGILALQSGGKDSLLTAALLRRNKTSCTPWYISSSPNHPAILDKLGEKLRIVKRNIDKEALDAAASRGGLNGHVPITYIVMSLAVIDAILSNKNVILLSIGHEGEEPHAWLDDLPMNHQWSKTWSAEQAFSEYIKNYVSGDIHIGSPLRGKSELKIAELFALHAWEKYGHEFSSCNLANYKQGQSNQILQWDGECPKCANNFLLFAPFIKPGELKSLFGGQDLLAKPSLHDTYKGLLGIDGAMKPLECVGEVDELRLAYHKAHEKWGNGYADLPFAVPKSKFDYHKTYEAQGWAQKLLFD